MLNESILADLFFDDDLQELRQFAFGVVVLQGHRT
jgi:hypothetical protein